jgi:hypothetical protein
MDPLSIVASASALVFASVRAVKGLCGLRECYKTAGTMIASISSECMVLHIALSQIQKLALIDSFFDRLASQLDLKDSLELALLSCTQTLSALEEEIRELSPKGEQKGDHFLRLKYLWNEETMREILLQLRSQQNAISVLLTAIQTYGSHPLANYRATTNTQDSERISDIYQLLLNSNIILERLAKRSDDLWSLHRKPNDDTQSIFSFSESIRSDTKFGFDSDLRSSEVYRRVSTANRRAREAGKIPDTFANGDLIDFGIDLNAEVLVDQPYLDEMRRNMTTFAAPSIPAINSSTMDDDLTNGDTLTGNDPLAGGRPPSGDGNQQGHQTPTAAEDEEDISEQLIDGTRLLEYRKTRPQDRLPTIRRLPSFEPLPAGWSLRTDPRGRAYYIDHFERYLFYTPPVPINKEDIYRALPTGWKRVETAYGRVRWVHDATCFVSHKHPYDNLKLFGYDFLNDWPFGRHGERRGTMRVYPRAFDFVGDSDAACQMTTEALTELKKPC